MRFRAKCRSEEIEFRLTRCSRLFDNRQTSSPSGWSE
ncbi:unnamed protein product, partial [Brassica rapa]